MASEPLHAGPTPEIVGVIDLMGGRAVRAVAGRRDRYQPLVSPLVAEPTAEAVAEAYRRLGLEQAYLADLDAIAGKTPDWPRYGRLLATGLRFWIDAGVRDVSAADQLAIYEHQGRHFERVIVAGESLARPDDLREIVAGIGRERTVFSLDLADGRTRVAATEWREAGPVDIARQVFRFGVRQMIVLDLAAVGMRQGLRTESLLAELREALPELELISGGGVRGRGDLARLAAAGCKATLVSTALHEGWGREG